MKRHKVFSSIAKKQIVAVTGLALIGFIIAHLAGNLFIYGGPDVFNAYAEELAHFRPALYVVEYALLAVFIIHIWVTALLVLENIKARGGLRRYAVDKPVGNRSLATRLMPYSGTYILLFVLWHLLDFTFIDHDGPRSYIAGKSYGLYGVVVNSFADPAHSFLYIVAMCFLGLHLAHGAQSCAQTFGFNHPKYTPAIKKFSRYFAVLIVIAYSSIPLYVLFIMGTRT
ncbi:MAG: succinate dehydrogenase cytochrome b subunit [Candidatus Omnitrophica bacterium]|nr:succinate dehydrogenase cytochrome b subunit [Candidatus Omnitrophota bacterium]